MLRLLRCVYRMNRRVIRVAEVLLRYRIRSHPTHAQRFGGRVGSRLRALALVAQ